MEPESMVHALEQIHELLNPGGHLIDIHPNGELVEFTLPLDEGSQFIGYMQETDDYIEYHQANDALDAIVTAGLFQVVESGEFEFLTHADSFDELKIFLDENWSDAIITGEVIASARRLEKEHGKRKTLLREQVRIGLLKKIELSFHGLAKSTVK
jgi:hypothetical protein